MPVLGLISLIQNPLYNLGKCLFVREQPPILRAVSPIPRANRGQPSRRPILNGFFVGHIQADCIGGIHSGGKGRLLNGRLHTLLYVHIIVQRYGALQGVSYVDRGWTRQFGCSGVVVGLRCGSLGGEERWGVHRADVEVSARGAFDCESAYCGATFVAEGGLPAIG